MRHAEQRDREAQALIEEQVADNVCDLFLRNEENEHLRIKIGQLEATIE